MKIVLLAPFLGIKQYGKYYSKIINYLSIKGHSVKHNLIVTNATIFAWDNLKKEMFFKNLYESLRECNLIIAEWSFPNTNIGYEIALAIQQGKDVILLKTTELNVSYVISSPRCDTNIVSIYEYTNTSLVKILDAILYNQFGIYEEFNLMLTKRDLTCKKEKVPKSVYIRQIIEKSLIG